MIVDELIAILGYETKGEAQLSAFRRNIDGVAKGISAIGVAAGTFVGTIAANAFMQLGNAIGSLPGNIIGVSAQFEGFQTSLETIEGSAEKAKASMDWITQFAAKTPYELDGVTSAFIKLKSYGIDPMNGTLETLGDTASAMNKPLDMAVEAFADATNFQFERLREFGLVASQAGDQVTFQWTKNGQTLTKTLKKSGADIQKFLKDHFGSSFSGAMIRQSKTWSGMVSNLVDGWNLFQKRIGDKGFFDSVKNRLAGLLDTMGELDRNGTLDRWAQSISDGLTWGVDQAVFAVSRLMKHFDTISNWVSVNEGTWEKIKIGLAAIGAVMFPKTAALLVLEDVLSFLEGGDSLIGDFAKSLSELTGVDVETAGGILATIAASGAGLLIAGPAIAGVAGSINALAASLGVLGGAKAAGGLGVLGRIAAVGAGIFGTAAVIKAGEQSILNDPEMNKRTEDGKKQIHRWRQSLGTANDNSSHPYLNYSGDGSVSARPGETVPDLQQLLRNLEGNTARMGSGQAAAAVENTVNDSRNQSVRVDVGGVVVNGVPAATAAVGAAVGSAVGNSAARSSGLPPTRISGTGAF